MVGLGWWGCAKLWYNVRYEAVAQLQDQPVLLPDAACVGGLHRGCRRREESLFARQAVQDSAQGKGGGPGLTPPLLPHHWGQTLGVPNKILVGWDNYLQCGYPTRMFDKVNWYVRNRLYLHFNRKSQRGYVLKYAPNFYQELQAMGLHMLRRRWK